MGKLGLHTVFTFFLLLTLHKLDGTLDSSALRILRYETGLKTGLLKQSLVYVAAEDRDAAEQCLLSLQRIGLKPDPRLVADLGEEAAARLDAAALVNTEDIPAADTSSWDSISVLEDSVDETL